MSINLRHYILEPFSLKNSEHKYILNRLASDIKVKKYISLDFTNFVNEANPDKKFDDGACYAVKKDDEIIGLLGTTKLDEHGLLELWLALNPSDSGRGNGTKILVETTSYLIDTLVQLKDIKLVIKKDNYISKQSAINGGYILSSVDNTNNMETYRYFGK